MIASPRTSGLRRDRPVPAGDDPRRSYNRGAWVGEVARETDETRMSNGDRRIDLTTISLDELRQELDRRQKGLATLLAKRAAIAQELVALDLQIRALQAADRPASRARTGLAGVARPGAAATIALPRQKNSISLPDAVALEAEPGQVVTPPEIARRVLASGYHTRSKTFTAVVTNVLSNDQRFKRVGRGRYERLPD
jgi:hypothetical protein